MCIRDSTVVAGRAIDDGWDGTRVAHATGVATAKVLTIGDGETELLHGV